MIRSASPPSRTEGRGVWGIRYPDRAPFDDGFREKRENGWVGKGESCEWMSLGSVFRRDVSDVNVSRPDDATRSICLLGLGKRGPWFCPLVTGAWQCLCDLDFFFVVSLTVLLIT